MNFFLIAFGKFFSYFSKMFNVGNGSTWPGHIALSVNPHFINDVISNSKTKIIIVSGTNGKTTTGRLITSIIRENKKTYLQNKSGANLLNGLASSIVSGSSLSGKLTQDYLIFESDENALPQVIIQTNPDYIICLDLFRDQLDRYGEIDVIAKKWSMALGNLSKKTKLLINADDPLVYYLSKNTIASTFYFGLEDTGTKKAMHGADSIYCPNCQNRLSYETFFFSHLGIWKCTNCNIKRPKLNYSKLPGSALAGKYNKYNCLAAALLAKLEGFSTKSVENAFKSFTPAFGRQEKIEYKEKEVVIFLSKNPTSFNESLQTIKEIGGLNLLIVLNDRIPDGLDVSWIWDINFENIITKKFNITVSGDRAFDIALRLKYCEVFTHTEPDLETALNGMVKSLDKNEILYVLPNYSGMLDVRKILTGKKIL